MNKRFRNILIGGMVVIFSLTPLFFSGSVTEHHVDSEKPYIEHPDWD
ncbi:hypothetical protein [Alteribacter natronophilus]|nr:hypothetical protein [Alteribacter natronophilus]